jgi:hypothetical protein
MAADSDCLNDFLARIDPYGTHWSSIRFACIAVRVGTDWVHVVGNATLGTGPSEPEPIFKRIVDLDDFRAYAGHLEAKALHRLIGNLKESMVISGFADDSVRLVPSGSEPYSWHPPSVHKRRPGSNRQEEWPNVWSVRGAGSPSGSFPPANLWRDIDTRLRRHDPPCNGLAGLCATLDLQFTPFSGDSPNFELAAELPARFLGGEVKHKEKALKLSMRYVGTPELVIEWLAARKAMREPVPAGNPRKPGQFEKSIPIPPGATGVEARLLAVEMDVDQLSLRVDWENILLRICEFFDPGQARLSDFLYNDISLKNVNPFELGVARLLGLAGYTVLWFGKAAKEGLPDLLAYMRTPLGTEHIIYAECTLKNPADKFSDFVKRAGDLREHLGRESGSILPVVFVRNEVTDQDRQTAAEWGLALCGGGDITQLQEKIKSDAAPDEAFQFLRFLGSDVMINRVFDSL